MTTSHPGQPGIPVPSASETDAAGAGVPVIPQWFREWGWVPLGFVFLIFSAVIDTVGREDGKGIGWFLFLLLLTACAVAWILAYRRRLGKARAAFRLGLLALSCLEAVDAMTGPQFEFYYALRAILAEAAQAELGLSFGRWEQQLRTPYRRPAWPCRTEAGRACLAWRLLQRIASSPPGTPGSSVKRQRGLVLEYALGLSRADGNIHAMTRRFTDFIVTPLFEFLQEQAAAQASVLYVLERYVRRVEWFDRDDLYDRAMEDTRKTEQVYDADLRRFLFTEGINMPFSQASSASGLSDVIADLHTEDPLVCEVKIFDAAGRSRSHLASGVTQAIQYATDYGQQIAYLLIINLSGRPLALPSDDPKTWPPRITVAGTSVYLIAVRALPTATASKLGKPAPVTISHDELVDPDL